MATRTLTLGILFTDASKRNLTFSPLGVIGGNESAMAGVLKQRIAAIKNETLANIEIDGTTATALVWKNYLLSKTGAPASTINDATYTITESTRIYDSATYNPEP